MNTSKRISFREIPWKYELMRDAQFVTPITGVERKSESGLITIDRRGLMVVRKGYRWDGASGPTVDGRTNMRASLFHDAGYQMIGEKNSDGMRLVPMKWRKYFDETFHQMLREDGMSRFRAWYWKRAVRTFGKKYAARDEGVRKVYIAPNR